MADEETKTCETCKGDLADCECCNGEGSHSCGECKDCDGSGVVCSDCSKSESKCDCGVEDEPVEEDEEEEEEDEEEDK